MQLTAASDWSPAAPEQGSASPCLMGQKDTGTERRRGLTAPPGSARPTSGRGPAPPARSWRWALPAGLGGPREAPSHVCPLPRVSQAALLPGSNGWWRGAGSPLGTHLCHPTGDAALAACPWPVLVPRPSHSVGQSHPRARKGVLCCRFRKAPGPEPGGCRSRGGAPLGTGRREHPTRQERTGWRGHPNGDGARRRGAPAGHCCPPPPPPGAPAPRSRFVSVPLCPEGRHL